MIRLRNTKLAALAAVSAIGIGAAAAPVAAVAASAPAHTTTGAVEKSPDRSGVKDTSRPDLRSDKGGSVDRTGSADPRTLDR